MWDELYLAFPVLLQWKDAAKGVFHSAGLEEVWDVLRRMPLNPRFWIFLFICLALERAFPARPVQRTASANLALDGFFPLLVAATGLSAIAGGASALVVRMYEQLFPGLQVDLLGGQPLWLQAVCAFVVVDFAFYVSHLLRHKIRPFWHFHAIHHSQTNLNPLTTFRGHPLEAVVNSVIRTVPIALVGGEPRLGFLLGGLSAFWSLFIHSNVKLDFGWLRYVIVTPQYHRIHHSLESQHIDRNFGERLTVWDVIFGTAYFGGRDEYPATGIRAFPVASEDSVGIRRLPLIWLQLMVSPFVEIWRDVTRSRDMPADADGT